LTSDDLFTPIFVPRAVQDAVSGRAWLQALLDAERALAVAEAQTGTIPAAAAETIADCCQADRFDASAIAEDGRRVGNPAEPLVRALRAAAGEEAGRYVHFGATSQDIVDTAAMLVSHRALALVLADLDGVAAACAALAEQHAATPMVARTLLQQALPTTFGLKAAGWLVAVVDARRRLAEVRDRLPAQLGGAAGTLASLGEHGPDTLRLFAAELGLREPAVPWHTARVPVAELGGALDLAAGTLAKIALDITLLAQTEVGEVAEGNDSRGGSSTLPHKRNPLGATLTIACARQVHGHASVLAGALVQEHERASGAWHAEWLALTGALELTGGAVAWARETIESLTVQPERMRANLDATGGLIMAEAVAFVLAERIGLPEAQRLVGAACRRAVDSGRPLRDELADDPAVTGQLSPEEIDAALDPTSYVGSAAAFVDRALTRYRDGEA
jgi:3-carboxy-cis,cis-muconate cycloisomerase